MLRLEQIVREALIAEGIAAANWRIEVAVRNIGSYNWCGLDITVYEPRCRKPATIWTAPYDVTRNLLHWEEATLQYNKYSKHLLP